MPLPASTPGPTSLPRVVVAPSRSPFLSPSLSVLYRPLPSRPPSLADFCTTRLEALSIALARYNPLASRYNERKRELEFTYVFPWERGALYNRLAREPPATAAQKWQIRQPKTFARRCIRARLGNDVAARKRAARCSIDFLAKRRREGAHFCADTWEIEGLAAKTTTGRLIICKAL